MTIFQGLGLSALAFFFIVTIVAFRRRALTLRGLVAWTGLWIAAGAAIWQPQLTVIVAHAVGIRRGADLVFYVAILAMIFGFLWVYLRLRHIEENITRLVRELALRDETQQRERGEGDRSPERSE